LHCDVSAGQIELANYTAVGERRKSGKNRCRETPQKGHVGSADCCRTTDEETCLMFFLDNRVKNKAGASFVAHLAQQLQYQEGTAGQT
jgi:hypothetical protein